MSEITILLPDEPKVAYNSLPLTLLKGSAVVFLLLTMMGRTAAWGAESYV